VQLQTEDNKLPAERFSPGATSWRRYQPRVAGAFVWCGWL